MEQELELKSINGELLKGKLWGDPVTARAMVVLVHGLGEHVQRYEHVAEAFLARNFALMGFDQQGHGKTAGKRGVIAPNDSFLRDLEAMVVLAKQLAPGKKIFLYGHSMGALEVLYYGLKGHESVSGIMATSPALDPGTMSKAQKMMVKLMKPLLPNLAVDNGLALDALSRDPEVVQRYRDDPLVHLIISRAGVAGHGCPVGREAVGALVRRLIHHVLDEEIRAGGCLGPDAVGEESGGADAGRPRDVHGRRVQDARGFARLGEVSGVADGRAGRCARELDVDRPHVVSVFETERDRGGNGRRRPAVRPARRRLGKRARVSSACRHRAHG